MRIEFVHLGGIYRVSGHPPRVIRKTYSALPIMAVTTTAAGSRPAAPTRETLSPLYARTTALDAPIIAAWRSNPTAADTQAAAVAEGDTQSLRMLPGNVELVPIKAGWLLSFIEVT